MSAFPFQVAVVMPVRNGRAFIGEALESILAQDLSPTEIIVVDDGSTDDSAAVARAVDPKVRVLVQDPAGAGAAKNRGVAVTSAPWIAFLDSDDRWLPGKLSQQRAVLEAAPEAVAAIGLVRQFFDPSLGRTGEPKPSVLKGTATSALVIRRDAFDTTGGFPSDPEVPDFASWWLGFQTRAPVVAMVQAVVTERRLHGANSSVDDPMQKLRYVRMVKAMLDRRRGAGS